MKNTIAAKHATAKKILTWSQSISLLYEILEVCCLDQIAARLIDAWQATADRDGSLLMPRQSATLIAIGDPCSAREPSCDCVTPGPAIIWAGVGACMSVDCCGPGATFEGLS